MTDRLARRIEIAAYVATILLALVSCTVLTKRFLFVGSGVGDARIPVGTKISLPGRDWTKSEQTVLLVLSTTCHFCTDSAPFYKRLVQEAAGKQLSVVAVLPQPVPESRLYLSKLGVSIDDVVQESPTTIGARGTPTIIILDHNGAVTYSWAGKLPEAEESRVLTEIEKAEKSSTR
jgi:thioredoxin-related protein